MSGPRIGLALGGGSARGLAHIPILEAFDELGVKPAVIAGCSMGAVVAAAYAGGMTALDMRLHAEKLLNNRMDAARYVFGARQVKLRELLSLKGFGSVQISGERLADLALPDSLPTNIEDTKIPLKIITTDYELLQERVLTSGSLVKAVAASISIPGVITGPKFDGRIHVDGGVTNPVPFDHVREGTDLTVAIDVTGRPRPPVKAHPSNMEIAVGSLLIMFHEIAALRRALSPPDIYIEPDLNGFGGGDFFRAKEIFAAMEPVKEKLKRSLDLRIERIT
ncbi:MAG: patatin-like phospholipase family protein [Rhizobiales bacterium]|nr:patatin-like phospholipase family protein [Hyphomicrobiales bacterium]